MQHSALCCMQLLTVSQMLPLTIDVVLQSDWHVICGKCIGKHRQACCTTEEASKAWQKPYPVFAHQQCKTNRRAKQTNTGHMARQALLATEGTCCCETPAAAMAAVAAATAVSPCCHHCSQGCHRCRLCDVSLVTGCPAAATSPLLLQLLLQC